MSGTKPGSAPEQSTARESAPNSPATSVVVLGEADVTRAITRIAHEIIERNHGLDGVVIVGLQRGGVWIAERLGAAVARIEDSSLVPVGRLDVALFRDDIALRPVTPLSITEIAIDLAGSTVILVDDVLFTGRTVRAALDALNQYGRPAAVQLAVMVDRGHRELPIRPDYVGKNLPTARDEDVIVTESGVTIVRQREK
ncbi:MAG: bifunctional pyr operon transcriptional regulator/uracil phosphoribosyltransferase PyrR [Actinobacteria bacterium]|nr:bifunctional pyr operon transcriptional regulator/uracil phosphoribosyltransferase PyrR [Actinomycetota bacterium]